MNNQMKALYIVVNAGFAEQIVDFVRAQGAGGATIINARGASTFHKEIFGISTDSEKEIILTLTDGVTAEKIMVAVKQLHGFKSEAHGISFALPVCKTVGISE
jgi:hypothetical protein